MLKGRPISLTILDFGQFLVHSGPRIIGIMGGLLRTDAGEVVVIDTGFPAKYVTDRAAAAAEDDLGSFGELMRHGPENWVGAQLQMHGVSKVDLLILTHTHIDHVGGLELFSQVPIVMAAAERALDKPLYFGAAEGMDWPAANYLTIEQDTGLGPGLDLFFTPGHAPGQLALGIDLPGKGRVIWASDAISRESEPDEGFADAWDPKLAAHHAARLLAMPHDLLIYGHDPEQWLQLPKGMPIT